MRLQTLFKKRLTGVLSLIALIALSEVWLIPHLLQHVPARYTPWNRVFARQAALRNPQSYDVLALGDSTGVQSLMPMEFALKTGHTMYNYGTYGGRAPLTDIYFFMEYMRLHKPPKALITVRSPYFWHQPQSLDSFYKQFPHLGLSWQLYGEGLVSLPQVMHMALYEILPSLFYREQVATMRTLFSDRNKMAENVLNRMEMPGQWGYEPFNLKMHTVHPDMDEENWNVLHEMQDKEKNITVHPDNLILLKLLCKNASVKDIPLYVTTGPYSKDFRTNPAIASVLHDIEDALETALADEPLCTYWRTDRSLPAEYRSDPTHAILTGAVLFTDAIAKDFLESEGLRNSRVSSH